MNMEGKQKQSDCNDVLQNQRKKINLATTDFMNYYISVPQLESIAAVKVVTMLCRLPDVRDEIVSHSYDIPSFGDNYRMENILNKLPLLPLPNLIKAKVSPLIRPIVLQICKWLECIRTNIKYDVLDSIGYSTFLDYLCWTSQGIVDRAKTLKQLIEANYNSDLLECKQTARNIYELACTYCIEDVIPSLWEKIAEETKVHYLNSSLYENASEHLVAYWSSVNNNELSALFGRVNPDPFLYNLEDSIFKNMFSLALLKGNIVAVKFFWDKLTAEEIKCNLEKWVDKVIKEVDKEVEAVECYLYKIEETCYQWINEYADILYFLLSKLSSETRKKVIHENINIILQSSFLYWPYQRFLLPTIQTEWDSLDEKVYIDLLKIVAKVINKDKISSEIIIKELWYRSPKKLKHCFIRDIIRGRDSRCVLHTLLAEGDIETVKEIISYADVEEKKQIAENMKIHSLPDELIDNFNVVDQFFHESLLSDSAITKLKEKIGLEEGGDSCYKWFLENDWQMVHKFLNWAFTSQEQINNFKYNVLNKIDITYEFLKEGNYEFVNKFMNWCFLSEQEINQFKKSFVLCTPEIVRVGEKDWCLFEKFFAWSSLSEQEINEFKLTLLESKKLKVIICDSLISSKNIKFVDMLINWCCHSNEEIQLCKEEFVLSSEFLVIVSKFQNNLQLMKNLFNLFSPFTEKIKIKLKDNFVKDKSSKHVLRHLFSLLDVNTEDEFFNQVSSDELDGAFEINSAEVSEASEINSGKQGKFWSVLNFTLKYLIYLLNWHFL